MKRQYLMTERTHYMCPNMHFGMILEIKKEFDLVLVQNTLDLMAKAHPFLNSLIAKEEETNRLYYRIMPTSQIVLSVRENEDTLWNDYDEVSANGWNVFKTGLLKVFIYPTTTGMKVLFVMHHLLVDGRGALEIVKEFSDYYVKHIQPVYVEEQLMESINDLPSKSVLSGISKLLIKQANAQWKKENQFVSYEQYSDFVMEYVKEHKVEHDTYILDKETVSQMNQTCHENGFTMNDLLMAKTYLRAKIDKIIIAADIRNAISNYKKGALGNYSTALGITCRSKEVDEVKLA